MDETVTRREFDRVVMDHERRMDGHDELYSVVRDTREELVRFTEALKAARDEIMSGVNDRDLCKAECAGHRRDFDNKIVSFDKRIVTLERFRWQISGIVGAVVAAPAWVALVWTLTGPHGG